MNGVVSASMREKGLGYGLNFGVELPRLRQLAAGYEADALLADALWGEDTRELKILATMLYPRDAFSVSAARRWAEGVCNQEIREQLCLNLLQYLPFAGQLVLEWTDSASAEIRTTGYWLAARLVSAKKGGLAFPDKERLADLAMADLADPDYFLRLSALNALKFIGRSSSRLSSCILRELSGFENSGDPLRREIYASLRFEFEYMR